MVWLQAYPVNAPLGKPEHTWFKTSNWNDRFYVVQRALKFSATPRSGNGGDAAFACPFQVAVLLALDAPAPRKRSRAAGLGVKRLP